MLYLQQSLYRLTVQQRLCRDPHSASEERKWGAQGKRVPGPLLLANQRRECVHYYKTKLRQATEKQMDGSPEIKVVCFQNKSWNLSRFENKM